MLQLPCLPWARIEAVVTFLHCLHSTANGLILFYDAHFNTRPAQCRSKVRKVGLDDGSSHTINGPCSFVPKAVG